MQGILNIVATPIGNLGDITLRALEILKSVDLVLCEDTRVTKKLLSHYEIKTPTKSFHQHSEVKVYLEITKLLEEGKQIALVTDAGTPGISDPGNNLVHFLVEKKVDVQIVAIPGPSALAAALSISGFPTDKFLFLGFPPHKKGRKTYFEQMKGAEYTIAFFESNHRIIKTLSEMAEALDPTQKVCVCRELTKKFETAYRGTIEDIPTFRVLEKGEFVVLVHPLR